MIRLVGHPCNTVETSPFVGKSASYPKICMAVKLWEKVPAKNHFKAGRGECMKCKGDVRRWHLRKFLFCSLAAMGKIFSSRKMSKLYFFYQSYQHCVFSFD